MSPRDARRLRRLRQIAGPDARGQRASRLIDRVKARNGITPPPDLAPEPYALDGINALVFAVGLIRQEKETA